MIQFSLFKNKLTTGLQGYLARVRSLRTLEQEAVIDRMVWRGSTINRADIAAVLEDYFDALIELIIEGYRIRTPFANYGVTIRGNFAGRQDEYDPDRHQVRLNATAGRKLRAIFAHRVQVEKQEAVKPVPKPITYIDANSGTEDSTVTVGGLGRLIGLRLKLDPSDPNQGIFFIASDGSATRVEVIDINTETRLTFQVPATLDPGLYTIEVRAIPKGATELRRGLLDELLTVTPPVTLPEPPVLNVPVSIP